MYIEKYIETHFDHDTGLPHVTKMDVCKHLEMSIMPFVAFHFSSVFCYNKTVKAGQSWSRRGDNKQCGHPT